MSRFGRDSEWIKRLEGDANEAVAEALARGEEVDPSLIPPCRARGPGGVECSEFNNHAGDHKSTMPSGPPPKEGRHGAFELSGRPRRKARTPSKGQAMTWPRICQASFIDPEATMYTCGLPLGHGNRHMCGTYAWD